MGEVTVLPSEDDPEALVILASGVPSSPVKRPTFRVRNSRTRAYVSPTGYQSGVHEFAWDVTREEDLLKFSGSFDAFRWVKADDPLTLEIPAVSYSADISLPIVQDAKVEPQAAPKVPEPASADSEERFSPDNARMSVRSRGLATSGHRWPIVLAIMATAATACAGWEFLQVSSLSAALADMTRSYEAEKSAREAERDVTKRAVVTAKSENERLTGSLSASEQKGGSALKDAVAARAELKNEQNAHAATRDRLASLQRDLDAARFAARTVPPQQVEPSHIAPQPAPVASPVPQAGVWPQTTVPTLPATPSIPPAASPASAAVNGTDCDQLAANPNDPRHVGAGVKFPDLKRNTAAAIEACDRALAASPSEQRFRYQKARALYAANDMRSRAMFDELMNTGYPAAFDNAAQFLVGEGKMREAEVLLRRGVSLQDPDAMVSLADAIKAGSISARTPGEDVTLYQMAAKLGHQSAKAYVEQQQAVGNFISQTGGQLLRAFGR